MLAALAASVPGINYHHTAVKEQRMGVKDIRWKFLNRHWLDGLA